MNSKKNQIRLTVKSHARNKKLTSTWSRHKGVKPPRLNQTVFTFMKQITGHQTGSYKNIRKFRNGLFVLILNLSSIKTNKNIYIITFISLCKLCEKASY